MCDSEARAFVTVKRAVSLKQGTLFSCLFHVHVDSISFAFAYNDRLYNIYIIIAILLGSLASSQSDRWLRGS
jgi:hypothetical protein